MASSAPIPFNEKDRLARVTEMCVMAQESDAELDALVSMVSQRFSMPICLISIVSARQQWFKAKVGVDSDSTSRDVSFCAHTILGDAPLEITDATLDSRFTANPLVTGTPGIRYYCGAPLITEDGFAIGSLCLIDTVPRPAMSQQDLAALVGFAALAMKMLTGIRLRNFLDQPTGLWNRVRLEYDVANHLAQKGDFVLLAVDIMPVKTLNDIVKALGYNYAHDLTLRVKSLIVGELGSGIQLYKISPTRFGIILPGTVDIRRVCGELVQALLPPVECHGIPVSLDAGIGVLPVSSNGSHDLEWLRWVVNAAEDARHSARRWSYYDPEVDATQRRAFLLLSSLSQALASPDQFRLAFQPRIDLASGECRSAEALLRWRHPELGDISPAEFIPLAEKTALITDISLWVMASVVRYLKQCPVRDLVVSMNVTARDLESCAFIDRLLEELATHGVDPTRIELEFTESVLIEHPEVVDQQLQRARRVGISVAIDDFGTGYSNWAYLSRIPAAVVKLDKTLIQKIFASEKDALLVRTLIDLAGELGYRVAAEGIETVEVLEQVKAWGCAEAQGFYLARPMAVSDFERWHRAQVP
ncbi:MAG TPA: EAL domain-containing protein [Pseudomonas sp.]|uniref:sensor domain-containing diguanylate cyclase n=1 Tax=Pseudomonas sp. TaxID=306 RepID=UPI002B495936|nr:EAL domain-containing protein [Pseudomonas sp.]HKS13514.1 EAL domain-containing protein [Pseudomonas sp.]